MAIIKCKMCGGDLVLTEGATIAECEYCGTNQTVPNVQNDVIRNLFNRANNLRIKCEFDKAEQIYEKILQEDDTQAEAHWGIVLCKYGIEYVEDPKTYKRIPTCHRTSFESVIAGAEYQAALLHADMTQRGLYEAEAATIDAIQKNILDVVRNEEPFDVFLCYKQTDEYGKRTVDSAIANEIYYQLTQEGLKVFYAAITLEDKLGQAYEPYIFAALNSAKVMLVIGTRPEFFTAVWVKNEWSRFMKLMKTDRSKLLIPCYKDMDAYDLPEEFAHLQAQDMAKIGFINDVVRGIRKVLTKESAPATPAVAVVQTPAQASSAPLLKRAAMFLEDGQWDNAEEYSEKVLDADPECAEAYLIKLLSGNRVSTLEKLAAKRLQMTQPVSYAQLTAVVDAALRDRVMEAYTVPGYYNPKEISEIYGKFDARYPSAVACRQRQRLEEAQWWEDNYFVAKVTRFADKEVAQQLRCIIDKVLAEMDERTTQAQKQAEAELQAVHERYAALEKTVAEMAQLRKNKREDDYRKNADMHDSNFCDQLRSTIAVLENMGDYKDAPALIGQYKARIQMLEEREAAYRAEQAKKQQALAAKAKKKKTIVAVIALVVAALVIAFFVVLTKYIIPANRYQNVEALMAEGKYLEADNAFSVLGDYQDSAELRKYNQACYLLECARNRSEAETYMLLNPHIEIPEYAPAAAPSVNAEDALPLDVEYYVSDMAYVCAAYYDQALTILQGLGDYRDSAKLAQTIKDEKEEAAEIFRNEAEARVEQAKEIKYQKAMELLESGECGDAMEMLQKISDYKDSAQILSEINHQITLIAELRSVMEYGSIDLEQVAATLDKMSGNMSYINNPELMEKAQTMVELYTPFSGKFKIVSGRALIDDLFDFSYTTVQVPDCDIYFRTSLSDSSGKEKWHVNGSYKSRSGEYFSCALSFNAPFDSTDLKLTGFIAADYRMYLDDQDRLVIEEYKKDTVLRKAVLEKIET